MSRDPTQPKTPQMGADGTPWAFDEGRTKPGEGHFGRLEHLERQVERTWLDVEPMWWPLDHSMVQGKGPGCRPVPPHLQTIFRDVFGADRVDTGRLVLCFHPLLRRWVIAQRRVKAEGLHDKGGVWIYETIWICSTYQTEELDEEYVPTDWREDEDIHRFVLAASGMHGQVGEYREPDRSDFEDVIAWGSTLQARREGTDLEQKHADQEARELADWRSTADAMDHDLVTHQRQNIFNWMNDGILTFMTVTDVRRGEYKTEWDVKKEYGGRNPLKVKLIDHGTWKEFVPRPREEQEKLLVLVREAEKGAAERAAAREAMSRPATRKPTTDDLIEEITERQEDRQETAVTDLDRLREHSARLRELN